MYQNATDMHWDFIQKNKQKESFRYQFWIPKRT